MIPRSAAIRSGRKPAARKAPASGLPAPVAGEAFSLIAALRRTTKMLTVAEAAHLLGDCHERTVRRAVKAGKIPDADVGIDLVLIDPKAWAALLEKKNPHLVPSARAAVQAAA